MNPLELNLQFPNKDHVNVRLDGVESGTLPFVMPLSAKDLRDVQWYVETYGVRSLGDPDDKEAERISALLPEWGKALFNSVFQERKAERIFNRFQETENGTRLLTVSAEHPAILTLPWELLHDPSSGGVYLFNETPRISIRRRVPGALGGRLPYQVPVKDRLHLLFVVSRPKGAGFINPRADAGAVMDALNQHALGCVTCEFLRPA
ncbi:MAG: hypothetical protein RBU21_10095, partial [FCB group bacterium]|nr:hypothetical protein [FCB group bacterium]